MGTYLNPGNSGFQEVLNSTYVDKTGLISLINRTINTKQKLTCVSRPRRFGKTYAAQMLCAYYDKTCDSSMLFANYEIAHDTAYSNHLNQYDVIYLDMTNIIGKVKNPEDMLPFIQDAVTEELLQSYPDLKKGNAFDETLLHAVALNGNKFLMIIDEWDAPIRETPQIEKDYLKFLRMLFKSSGTTAKIFAAAYMTGILPIKKDGSQSAISDFREYTMIKPRRFAPYVGFTENEVECLCKANHIDFSAMKKWYDGYAFPEIGSVYNPNSVMQAIENEDFDSYWTESSAAESLLEYISKDYAGLSRTITELIGGVKVPVIISGFANDLVTFKSRDDVLTLLIHLGYLAYDGLSETVHIPNEEIRLAFSRRIREVKREETIRRIRESDQLIDDVIYMNEEAVAAQIEKIHSEEAALFYNNEQSLRSVIKRAFFSTCDEFILFEGLPAGDGFADIVYLPKRHSLLPILMIELKWNQSAKGAIAQIKERHYPRVLSGYGGDILLIGVNYDKDAPVGKRKHTCKIEKYRLETALLD